MLISTFKNRVLTLDIQANLGTLEPQLPTSVMLTKQITMEPLAGATETIECDDLYNGGRVAPVINTDPHSIFGWDVAMTRPAAPGVMPVWVNNFRVCGFDVTNTGTAWVIKHATSSSLDYGSVRIMQEGDLTRMHKYEGMDGNGNLALEMVAGEIPMLKVSNFMTSYIRPEMAALYVPDYGTQKEGFGSVVDYMGKNVIQLDGHDICVRSMKVNDADGRTLSRNRNFCADRVGGNPKPVTIEIEYINSDWDSEFNIFELCESWNGVQQVPFVFDHDMIRVFAEVQCQEPEPFEMDDDGIKGIKLKLNVLADFEISVNH